MILYFRLTELALLGSMFGHRDEAFMLAAFAFTMWAYRKVQIEGRSRW